MDYFNFDLQLFATPVGMSDFTGTGWLDNEGNFHEEWPVDGETQGKVIAYKDGNTLLIKADTSDEGITVKATGAVATLANLAVSTVNNFKAADGSAEYADADKKSKITFTTSVPANIGVVQNVNAKMVEGFDPSVVTFVDNTGKVTLTKNCTVGNMTAGAEGATITLNATAANSVLEAGTVTVTKDTAAKVGLNTFTAANVNGTHTITRDGSVVTLSAGFATGQHMAVGTGNATFALDAEAANKLSLESGQVVIESGEAGLIHDVAYTAKDAAATVTAGVGTVTLDAGKVSFSAAGASLISGALTAVCDVAGEAVTVDATAGVSVAGEGKATVTIAAGGSGKIKGKTYKNPDTGNGVALTVTGAAVTLTDGFVTLNEDDAPITMAGIGTVTCKAAKKITVGSDGTISAIEAAGAFNVALAKDKSVSFNGATYTNAGPNPTAALTVTAAGTAIALAEGDVLTVTGESAAITTQIGTVTNKGAAKLTVAETGVLTPDSGAVYSVTLGNTKVVTIGEKTFKAGTADTILDVDNGVVTLKDKSVEIAVAGTAIVTDIGTVTFTGAGDGITVTEAGVVSDAAAGDDYSVALKKGASVTIGGTVYKDVSATGDTVFDVAVTAGPVETPTLKSGVVAFDKDKALTVAGVTVTNKSAAANHLIAVDTSGNVSQIAPGATFWVAGPSGKFTYTMTGTTLAKTGDAVGVYTSNGAVSVAPNGTVTGGAVAVKELTLKLNAAANQVANAGATTTTYYEVNSVGAVAYNSTFDPASPGAGVIGWFKAETTWNEGAPKVTVTFVGALGGAGTTVNATDYLGNITVDMEAVQKITIGGDPATAENLTLVVKDISGAQAGDADISVVELNKGATVSTSVGSITYHQDPPKEGLEVIFSDPTRAADLSDDKKFGVYAAIDEGAYGWHDTVQDVKDLADGKTYSIGAVYEGGVLTVANGASGKKVTLSNANLSAANLEGVTIRLVESFDANGTATTGSGTGVISFNAGTGAAGTMITMNAGESITFENDALRAQIPNGATVVTGGNTYTMDSASVMTLQNAAGAADLDDGTVTVAKGNAIKVQGDEIGALANTYTALNADVQITATAVEKNAKTGLIMKSAEIGTLVNSEISLGINSAIYVVDADEHVTKIHTATAAATVTSKGVVSKLANTQVITVTDMTAAGKAGDVTTYTIGTGGPYTITVSGKYAGVYSFTTPEAVTAATITSVYGAPDTITSMGVAAEPVALTGPLVLNATANKNYYKVAANGTVSGGDTLANSQGGIGYFKVVTSEAGGKTTVSVVYFNDDGGAGVEGSKGTLLPGVTVNFEAFQKVGLNDVTTVDVSGLSAGVVSLLNVPTTAIGDIQGLKTGDAAVDYFPTYALANGSTITLDPNAGLAVNGTKWTYAVTASEKDAATGVCTYSIGGYKELVGDPVGPCFVVTKAVDGSGNATYTVTYEGGNAAAKLDNLNEKCWANGVTVNASSLAPIEGKTVTIGVTTGGTNDKYTVNAQNGVIVTEQAGRVTGSWATTVAPTITYDDTAAKPEERQYITLVDCSADSQVAYWKVEKVNDGNNKITITKVAAVAVGSLEPNTNYIKVSNGTTALGTKGKVTVAYVKTNGVPNAENVDPSIKLSDLVGASGPLQVAIRAASDATTAIVVTDAGKGQANCVDYNITAYAGTTITGQESGDSVVWIAKYKNAAVINLDALAASTYESGKDYYYEVTATAETDLDKEGYRLVTLASDTPATDEPAATANYFKVTKNKGGVYAVTYHKSTGENAIALAAGKATLSVNGNETITSIDKVITDACDYKVTDATYKFTSLKTNGAGDESATNGAITYVEESRFMTALDSFNTNVTIDLGDLTTAVTSVTYDIAKTAAKGDVVNDGHKGVTQYVVTKGAIASTGLTATYVPATATEDAYIKIEFTQGTLTKAEFANIVNALKIDAELSTGGTGLAGKIAKIVLTKDSDVSIDYAIEHLSADIGLENFTDGKDTVAYEESFVMGTADTITLAKGTGKETTQYYVVTATDGKETKNIRTVSIATTPLAIAADATPKQIAEALAAAGGNYFTVTTYEDGAVTVAYTEKDIDLSKLKVNVDANAVTAKDADVDNGKRPLGPVLAQIITVDDTDNALYKVSGLDVGQSADEAGAGLTPVALAYNESFAVLYSNGTEIQLNDRTSGTYYYEVVRTEGTVGTQGEVRYTITTPAVTNPKTLPTTTIPASGHYFAVTYAAQGVTVTYFNIDGDAKYNLATVMGAKPQVTINASGVNDAITAINITDGATADTPQVNYALTEVDPDIEIVGKGEGDTVTTKPSVVWAANQTMTLTDNEVTYYALTGVLNETTKKVVVSIGAGTTTKPEEAVNYFTVKRTTSEATGKVEYEITGYHASNGGEAFDLTGAKAGTLTIDASKATGGITLNNDANGLGATAMAHFAVTNLPEVTVDATMAADDTVSYSTTFTWPTATVPTTEGGLRTYTYNYFVKATDGKYILTPGETATTTVTDAKTEYARVTVVKNEKGQFTISTTVKTYKGDGTTGAMGNTANNALITSLAAPSAAAEIDATGVHFVARGELANPKVIPTITGVAAGSKVSLAAAEDVDVVSGTLQADDKITIINTTGPVTKVYTAGETGTAITVKYVAGTETIRSGALVLGKGEELTSSVGAAAGINVVASLAAEGEVDGAVIVTFDAKKGITSITGLDIGETVTLTENATKYTYARNSDGYVVKTLYTDSTQKTYAAMDSSAIDILSLGYTAEQSITGVVGTFNWNNATATYYLAGDASGATVAYGTGTDNVASGSIYIKAEFTGGVLELTPMRGNTKGLLDPIDDYTGTITVEGDNHVVTYVKESGATYKVAVKDAKAGSAFTDLGADDTVATVALADGDVITMNVTGAKAITYTYEADAAGTMEFVGPAMKNGAFEVKAKHNADPTLVLKTNFKTADGSEVVYTTTDTANTDTSNIVVKNGVIQSIKNLDTEGETVTIKKDGITTVFTHTATAKTVTKTVTTADGAVTTTTITLTNETDDVWNATGTKSIMEGAFAWAPKDTSGYFLVNASGATTVVAGAGAKHDLANGEIFVKATITDVATTGVLAHTLTLTPMIVKDGDLVEATAGESTVKKVTITGAATILKYDGTGKAFNIEVTGAGIGSTFTNLLGGDVVTSVALAAGEKISVNGKDWTAPTGGTTYTIYSESPLASRIVAGDLVLTEKANTVDAAAADGSATQTMTYTAGTDNKDGVKVTYAGGVPTSITGLDLGESVKVNAVGTDGKTTVTEYTTAKGSADGKTVVYRTRGGVVTVREITNGTEIVDAKDNNPAAASSYSATDTSALGAYDWTEAATKKTTVTGYFLASEKGVVEAATRTEELTSDYTQYGRTYLVTTLTKDGGLTLQKATVGMTGKLGAATAIAANDKLDVTLTLPTAGLKITSLNGRDADTTKIKSLTIVNAGANSVIGTWTANDHITTVSMNAAVYNADGTVKTAADTLKLGAVTYTAGANGVMELVGTQAKNGTFQLSNAMKTIEAAVSDTTTGSKTVDAVTYTPNGTKDTANVTVTNGRVTGLTGFGAEETIKIVSTTTDKFGVATEETVTYTAALITDGLNKGQIEVTKTLEDGTSYTHTFKDTTQDVLASSVTWNLAGQDVTDSKFNWNNTGYFLAVVDDADKKTYKLAAATDTGTSVMAQTTAPKFKDTSGKWLEGTYYLQVTATKAMSGLVTISDMALVKLQSNGSFAAVKAGETMPKFTINSAATGGLVLPEHTAKLTITPAMGKTYTGLVAGDQISGTSTKAADTITVNGQAYKVTNNAAAFVINGDNTIESGVFTVEGTALASAVPQFDADTVTRSIVYTPGELNKDGVEVTFTANEWAVGSEITSVAGLAAGEKVVVTSYVGSLDKVNETTTITSDGTKITKTISNSDWSADVVMKKDQALTDVLTTTGYTVANKFDFGTTTAGTIGFFKAAANVAAIGVQGAAPAAFNADGSNWMIVGATQDASKNVTINYLKVVKDDGNLSEDLSTALKAAGGVTIDASKLEGGITLAGDAAKLCTVYKKVVAADGTVTYEVDKTKSDTDGRKYGIAVSGALAGKAYNGFAKTDTIAAGALKADDTITVGGLTYAVKAAAAADAVQFYGNGAAKQGEFKFSNTYNKACGYDGVKMLTTVTGSADATVTFAAGKLTSITEVGVGESLTVEELNNDTKAARTTKYTATANSDGTIKITREVTEDGVVTTSVGKSSGDLTDITKLTYSDATAKITSDFDWTAEKGSGYFLTTVTLEGSTVKDIGTIDIKPGQTTIGPDDAGKYVAKVTVTQDGKVDGIALHKVQDTGELGDAIVIPAAATGTLNITAPSVKVKDAAGKETVVPLTFDKTALTKLTVNITGAANGSVITALAKGDKLTTAALAKAVAATATTPAKAAEKVTVNGKDYVAGADGTMTFVDAGVMTDGTIVMNGALTIDATGELAGKYTDATKITIAHAGTDAPVVTVKDGVLADIDRSTLTAGSVTMTVAGTNASAKYEPAGVTVTLNKQKTSLTTLAMAEYDMVKFGSPQKTLYSGAANNKLEFVRDTGSDALAKNGVLRLTKANDAFTAAGSKSEESSDNVTVTFTKRITSSAIDVKVTNGVVTSIKGLGAGDAIQLADTTTTTVYEIDKDTPTKVTKTVTKGTEKTVYTAFITAGANADILAANYFGAGQDITEEENQIVGQLSWADVSGRSTGYFQVNSNKATIAEQSQKVTVTAAKGKTALWAVANVKDSADGAHVQTLSIDAMQVSTSADGKTTTVLGSGAKLLAGAAITVTAPTAVVENNIVPPLYFDKGTGKDAPTYAITLNKVAKDSVVKNIALGDKVITNTLKAATATAAAESVQMAEADGTLVVYRAGANGALTFVGEGDNTKDTSTGVARLLSGTVMLTAGNSVYLAGGADNKDKAYNGDANDLKVTAAGDNNVVVKVANGVISTVTGLDTFGATLEVTTGTGDKAPSVRYKVVDVDLTNKTIMIERLEGVNGVYDEEKGTKTYRTVKTTADFYAGDQSKTFSPMATETPTLTDWTAEGTKYAFIKTTDVTTPGEYAFTTTAAKKAGVTSDVIADAFSALPDTTYYRLTAKTAKNGMTTISAVDAMVADATSKSGKLVVEKAVNGVSPVIGTIVINGASDSPAKGETNGKITFALPAMETKRRWALDAKNLALGSVITGISKWDKVASGDGTYNLTKSDKTFTVYTNGKEIGTSTEVVTYAGADGATAKVEGGVLTITNMVTEKEKVTVVSDMDTAGLVTTEYLVMAGGIIQKTETAADGTKTVCTSKVAAKADQDIIKALEYNDVDKSKTTIVSDFNWTLDKSQVGYFAVATNGTAAVKTAKTTITAKQAGTQYLAVELDGEKAGYEGRDGVVKSIKLMTFNTTTGKMEEASENSFSGKITITAPTTALIFDRATAVATDNNSVSENAQIVITGAAADSRISGLKARSAFASCDSVTTAKLTGQVYNANNTVKTWGSVVTVNGLTYTAGANGALGFTMQQVNGSDDERVTLTSGTILLTAGTTEGPNAAIVGKQGIVANNRITVAATTNAKNGVTTYTVGDLGENESFQVLTYGSETVTSTFKKSTSSLFFIAEGAPDDGTDGKYVYALGGKTTVASSLLTVSGQIPTAKGWQLAVETFTTGTDNFLTTTYGAVTVDLATLDKRYAADKKNNFGRDSYEFVIDRYLASGTKAAKALNAAVVRTQDTAIQTLIGSVTGATGVWRTYNATYDYQTAAAIDNQVGQTIKAADKWFVNGSDAADTITGAASGTDWLDGGAGNDLYNGGGAADTFVIGNGQDTIKSFANGKDSLVGAFGEVALQGADVLLWTDNDGSESYNEGDDGVLLVGMGNKKAININGANYYFGSGKATKAETFTFDVSSAAQAAASKYWGKENLANTLSIGTDKTKATAKTLGDTLVVDLSDAARYVNIAAADASKSSNRVDLTATAKGSTLKGGTYESTLRGGEANDVLYGGSGVDVFWAENLSGVDTVKSYTAAKDAVFLGNIDEDPEVATEVNDFTIQAVGKDIMITKGEASMKVEGAVNATKAFKISKDGTSKNTLSYYVGSTTAKANAFTATMDTDMKIVEDEDKKGYSIKMSSYYLGSEAMNVDTLKLSSKTKNVASAKFDMNALSRYLSTIDVIDTAGLAKGSSIELIGRESGTYTLKGSNNVTEKFNLTALALETDKVINYVTITNLGVGEIIELAEGVTATKTSGASTKNTYFKLTDTNDSSKSYGTLCITGVAASKFTSNSYTKSFSRN